MVLCSFCENITIDRVDVDAEILAQSRSQPLDRSQRWREPPGYGHQPNYPALLESAKSCELCRFISEVAEQDGIFPKFDPQFDAIPDQIARRNASQRLKLSAFRQSRANSSLASNHRQLSGIRISNAQGLHIWLEMFADEDSAAALSGDVTGRPVHKSASCESNFDLMLSWMQACLHFHQCCSPIKWSGDPSHPNTLPDLPTRVLYVGTSDVDMIRLSIPNGSKGQYSALSHRWGEREKMECTTTALLGSRVNGIPVNSLSQLFRNAITVTRRLGLLYIWIDSLCILQDSREDWERESALMGDVYGRATIVISAIASEDGFSGFLRERDTKSVRVSYRKTLADPGTGFMYIRKPRTNFSILNECALNNRAWVWQERILARRLLSFTKDQIIWECKELRASEGGREEDARRSARKIMDFLEDLSLDRDNPFLKAKVFLAWRDFISQASESGITYESDRLQTILGIAKHVQRETGSEYFYGTWVDDLALELYWVVQPRNGSLFTCKSTTLPRAPSWCWASLEGPIRFMGGDLDGCSVCFERVVLNASPNQPSDALKPFWELHILAYIRDCEVTKNGTNWNQGNIPVPVPPDDEEWVGATKGGGLATFNDTGAVIGGSKFDLQPSEDTLGKYSCLLLLDKHSPGFSLHKYGIGLILQSKRMPAKAQDTYTRIGHISLSSAGVDWLKAIEQRFITLV